MRTLREILKFATSKAEPIVPPSPDEIALRFCAANLASGSYQENFAAAVEAGWWATAEYYRGRGLWQTVIAPTMFAPQSPGFEPTGNGYVDQDAEFPLGVFPTGAH